MEDKAPKNKKKARKRFLTSITKNQKISVGVIGVISIAGIIGGLVTFMFLPKGGKCIIGIHLSDFDAIDPILCVFQEEYLIWQVCESLFDNDFSGGEPELVDVLATGYEWNDNATELICTLRQGVKFHDGTIFNALAVKWNFDRIYRLLEIFPGLLNGTLTSWGYILILPDGRPIVNETQVINDYTVKFVLNEPFVPFLQLLTQPTTSILSPASTPANDFIDLLTGQLIGTGPFIYNGYDPYVNILMSRFRNYWGKKAKLDELELKLYPNDDNLMNAFLSKEFHLLDWIFVDNSLELKIDQFKSNPEFKVQESIWPNFRYIGLNNNSINITMRKAISYAINYTYFVENVTGVRGVRARSPIPEGCLYSNTTAFNVPNYNITYARKLLKDVGWPGTANLTANDNVSAGNEWEMLVINDTPLETYNFSAFPNSLHLRQSVIMPEFLKQIGVRLNNVSQFRFEHIHTLAWIYDYNDPHNGLYPVFLHFNDVELNDDLIVQWINDGVKETNSTERKQIYYNIQERLIEVLYPFVWTYSLIKFEIFDSNLAFWQHNPYKTLLKNTFFK
jgi:ABC-type transport system substrate-binding protein